MRLSQASFNSLKSGDFKNVNVRVPVYFGGGGRRSASGGDFGQGLIGIIGAIGAIVAVATRSRRRYAAI